MYITLTSFKTKMLLILSFEYKIQLVYNFEMHPTMRGSSTVMRQAQSEEAELSESISPKPVATKL